MTSMQGKIFKKSHVPVNEGMLHRNILSVNVVLGYSMNTIHVQTF